MGFDPFGKEQKEETATGKTSKHEEKRPLTTDPVDTKDQYSYLCLRCRKLKTKCRFDLGLPPHFACERCRSSRLMGVEDECKEFSPIVLNMPRAWHSERSSASAQPPSSNKPTDAIQPADAKEKEIEVSFWKCPHCEGSTWINAGDRLKYYCPKCNAYIPNTTSMAAETEEGMRHVACERCRRMKMKCEANQGDKLVRSCKGCRRQGLKAIDACLESRGLLKRTGGGNDSVQPKTAATAEEKRSSAESVEEADALFNKIAAAKGSDETGSEAKTAGMPLDAEETKATATSGDKTSDGHQNETLPTRDKTSDAHHAEEPVFAEDNYSTRLVWIRDHKTQSSMPYYFENINTWEDLSRALTSRIGPQYENDGRVREWVVEGPSGELINPTNWKDRVISGMSLTVSLSPEISRQHYALRAERPPLRPEAIEPKVVPGPKGPEPEDIHFEDASGMSYNIPWDTAKTWRGMEQLIHESFENDERDLHSRVLEGHFDLYGPEGGKITADKWEATIKPDMKIKMAMREAPTIIQPLEPEPGPLSSTRETEGLPVEDEPAYITIKDFVGRKLRVPWESAKSYIDTKTFIHGYFATEGLDAVARPFKDVDVKYVKEAFEDVLRNLYDFHRTGGEEITSDEWEEKIKPGAEISMVMWELPDDIVLALGRKYRRLLRNATEEEFEDEEQESENESVVEVVMPRRRRNSDEDFVIMRGQAADILRRELREAKGEESKQQEEREKADGLQKRAETDQQQRELEESKEPARASQDPTDNELPFSQARESIERLFGPLFGQTSTGPVLPQAPPEKENNPAREATRPPEEEGNRHPKSSAVSTGPNMDVDEMAEINTLDRISRSQHKTPNLASTEPILLEPNKPAKDWSADELCDWLTERGISKDAVEILRQRKITGKLLPEMKWEDLKKAGIVSFGSRYDIWTEINRLCAPGPFFTGGQLESNDEATENPTSQLIAPRPTLQNPLKIRDRDDPRAKSIRSATFARSPMSMANEAVVPPHEQFLENCRWQCINCIRDHRRCEYRGQTYIDDVRLGDKPEDLVCDSCVDVRYRRVDQYACSHYGPVKKLTTGGAWGPRCGSLSREDFEGLCHKPDPHGFPELSAPLQRAFAQFSYAQALTEDDDEFVDEEENIGLRVGSLSGMEHAGHKSPSALKTTPEQPIPTTTVELNLKSKEVEIPQERPSLPGPYKCPRCDLSFQNIEGQKAHMATHINARKHACTHPGCGKRFIRPDELTRHMRIHGG